MCTSNAVEGLFLYWGWVVGWNEDAKECLATGLHCGAPPHSPSCSLPAWSLGVYSHPGQAGSWGNFFFCGLVLPPLTLVCSAADLQGLLSFLYAVQLTLVNHSEPGAPPQCSAIAAIAIVASVWPGTLTTSDVAATRPRLFLTLSILHPPPLSPSSAPRPIRLRA